MGLCPIKTYRLGDRPPKLSPFPAAPEILQPKPHWPLTSIDIALKKPEVNIVVAGETPYQGNLFVVALELPVNRGGLPVIPGNHVVPAGPAHPFLLVRVNFRQRGLQ